MKKILISITLLLSILLSGCAADSRILIRKMNEKYSNNQNYVVLTGTIVEVVREGYVFEIKSEDLKSYLNYDTERFKIHGKPIEDLNVGDEIVFTTVVFHFYNGHVLPIVELKKDGIVLLSFEEGKQNLLRWVNEDFR